MMKKNPVDVMLYDGEQLVAMKTIYRDDVDVIGATIDFLIKPDNSQIVCVVDGIEHDPTWAMNDSVAQVEFSDAWNEAA